MGLASINDTLLNVPISTSVDGLVNVTITEAAATTHTNYVIALAQNTATSAQLTGSDAIIPVNIAEFGALLAGTSLPVMGMGYDQPFLISSTNVITTLTISTSLPKSIRLGSLVVTWSGGNPSNVFVRLRSPSTASTDTWIGGATPGPALAGGNQIFTFPDGGFNCDSNDLKISLDAGGAGIAGFCSGLWRYV